MAISNKIKQLYDAIKSDGGDVGTEDEFNDWFLRPGEEGYNNRKRVYDTFKSDGADVGANYEEFRDWLGLRPADEGAAASTAAPSAPTQQQPSALPGMVSRDIDAPMEIERRDIIADAIDENERLQKDEMAKKAADIDAGRGWDDTKGVWDNFVRIVGGGANESVGSAAPKANVTEHDENMRNLVAERQVLEETRKRRDAGRLKKSEGVLNGTFDLKNNARNIGKGVKDVVTDADFLLNGVIGMQKGDQLIKIDEKIGRGEELTDSELRLVNAALLQGKVESETTVPHGYTAGQTLAEMAPFMAQMALNPANGAASTMAKAAAKQSIKRFGKKAARRIATGVTIAGEVGESAVLANTLQATSTASDIKSRYIGKAYVDENGQIAFDGSKDWSDAIYRGEGAAIIENYTELLGSHFGLMKDGAGELVKTGVTKLGGGKLVNQVSDLVTRIGSTKWAQAIGNIEKRANWNGSVGEMLEEEAGIVLNSMFVGDNKISDLVDPEQQIDIALGVGLFGGFVSGIKTAGYPVARYNARRNLNRADVRASELMGDEWDGLRDLIDDAEEGDLSSIVASVIPSSAMTEQKQRAVVDYARALMTSRGYNISSESVREDGMASAEEVGAEDSFDAGYSITDSQEMVDARLEMERQRMKLVSSMSEDIADEFDADPLDALARTYDPEIREIASKYVNAKMVYDGMIQRVRDDIDGRIAQSDAMIDGRVNRDTGMIQGATLTDGKEVYVVNGNVAMLDDGVNVDVENSDESLIVRDAEGRLEFVAPSQVQSLLAPVDAASEKEAAAEAIRNEIAQSAADKIDGVLHFAPNDVYAVINEDGTQESLTIVGESVDASGVAVDGMVDVMREDGSVVAMNTADIQRMVDESNARRLDERDKARESAEADSGVEAAGAAAEEPRPSALSRIPTDQNGEPLYEEVDADTAWDAFVEQSEGDEEIAKEVVADIVAEKRKELADAEKALKSIGDSKPNASNGEGVLTIQERIAAKMASKRALTDARDAVERAKGVVEHWQSIGDTVKRRAEAEAAERRRQAEIAAEEARQAAERERAEAEEAERLKREALNGVPDWGYDTAADARARGYRRAGTEKVDRQGPIASVRGKEVDVKFSDRDIVKGRVAIIDAGELQPSHIQGDRNPAHFLDEAQPKERNDAASVVSAQKIASNIRPEEITSSVTAYTGAPTVNSRGEVIQGNSRSDALRLMYESQRESAQRYRQYLVDHAADFGLTPEQIVSMESPVLVNAVDVDDNEAIRLGQFVAQDTESGGVERIKAKNAVQKMGDKVGNFANMLLSTTDEEATFAQLVDANGVEVLKWMNQQGFITDTQYASAFNSRGNLTGEAVNDLKGIMYQSIFTGGSTRLEEIFNKMPAKAQRAILATAFRDYDSASADRMISEIQQSIIAFDALTGYEQFRDATNAEATQLAVEAWKRQYAFDDVSGESYLPSETFSNFALALAAMYKGHTQKHIQGVFNTMYDIIQGTEQDNLFEAADKTPKPLADAIRRVLNIDYQPIVKTITDNGTNGDTVLDIDSEDGQGGRPGSDADASGAEQDTRVAEPAVGGGGTTIDSGQGSEVNNRSKAFNYFTGSIKDLISLAMESAKGLYKKIVAPISDRLRTDLAQRGIILTPDYNHVIDNNAIRHALKKHGGKHEEKRGQIPLTDIDFERIEDVVTNYDQIRIEQGKRNDINIIYSKTYEDGTTIFVEEKRDGRKELAAVTMWKKKNFTHTDANHEVTPISDLSEVSDGKGNALSTHNQIIVDESPYKQEDNAESLNHGLDDLDDSALAERIVVSDDDWTEGAGETPIYKRTITIDGKHTVVQVDEPDGNGFYTGSYFDYQGERFGSIAEALEHIDKHAKLASDIAAAEAEVNTSPTDKQKEAGNYKKGHVRVGAFDVTIENPKGSVRRGTDATGKKWEQTMSHTYGYIKGTEGVDGDHIDVFLSSDIDGWDGRRVYVVDQYNPDGTFDEHKVMLGFNGEEDAYNAYLSNYESGWEKGRRLDVGAVDIREFEKWVDSSRRKTKAFSEYRSVNAHPKYDRTVPTTPEAQLSAISRIIGFAKSVKNRVERAVIGGITQRQAKDFADNGIEVDESWVHSFESSAVSHNQKHHGNEKIEAERGQIAITEDDYSRIPEILEDYDKVSKSPNKTKGTENEVIIYEKGFGDGYVYYLEEKRDNRKSLAFHTMYKKKKGTDSSDGFAVSTAPITPKATPDNLSSNSDSKDNRLSANNQINMEQSGVSIDATKVAKPGQNMAGATDGGYTIDAEAVTGMNDSQLSDEAPLSLDDMWSAVKPTSEETNATKEEISSSSEETPAASKPKNPSGNKLVTDEQYAELLAKMRKKMGGQLNMGVDPEILAIGSMMAVYHIEKGARKFTEYVKAMVADLGEKFPARYLKGFYKAAHEMIEDAAPEIAAEMDADGVVNSADIASIINDRVDAMATAAMVVEEEAAEGEREAAERKLKEERKAERTKAKMGKIGISTDATEVAEPGQNMAGANVIAENEEKPRDKKSGKAKRKAAVTDGGLFDSVDIPAIAKPAQRSESELEGDSAVYQKREMQTVELVEEIGGVIESRVMMLQLDAESVKPLTMTDVKKMASKYDALEDISDTDLQELVELAMTQLTRSEALINIDGTAEQQRSAYDHIVNLYRIQPSLNARDSERLIKQQYSTPTPFGYVMGQFVRAGGKPVGSMLEPSAGNGALTITVHPSLVHVNDIDDARLANLRKLNYGNVTAQDALLPFGGDKVDVVMTNPPFGTVAEKVYNGVFKVSSLEGQMAINALEKMKDDGRAAIIIGGNTSYRTNGSMNPKDAAFFGYLYSNYNVADVINISGKALYSRSGTGYDVRMILIDGRKSGEFKRVYPPVKAKARAEQVTTFDELYKRIQDDIQQIQQMGNTPADVQREPGRAVDGKSSAHVRIGNDSQDTGSGRRPDKAGDVLGGTRGTDIAEPTPGDDGRRPAGVGNAERGDGTGVNDVQRTAVDGPGRGELDKGVGDGRGRSGNDESVAASSRPDGNRQRLAVKTALGDEKVAYPNQSDNGFTLMSVVPAAQARVLQKSLGEVGDVDQYLVDELGYSSKDELYGYLAAEQIDSVALAIHQMNKGNAFIIGDMTGVGKGRQGAALIRYAVKHGKTPIYFTQKPTLFTDNYRDLVDIGSSNLRPFIMASVDSERSGDIVDAEGNVVYKIPSKKEKARVYKHIMEHGTLPDGYDYVLSTYSQIQNGVSDYRQNEDGTWSIENRKLPKKSKGYTPADHNGQMRRDALARLAEGNITILDESHTVGGDSGCGRYMQMLTSQAEGVTFLSATFAKRADNMPIYAQRTAIAEAGVKASELIAAIAKGGVTLQEIMSKQLVESGQMIRRERSFEGVTIDWLGVEEETDRRQREQFNEVAYIFNAIRNFQDDYITPIIEAKNEAAAEVGATVGHRQGAKDLGVKNVPFASKMYNLVNQLLFALKVDAVADRVIDNLRNGYKPVISFTNTMEGFLSSAPKGEAMDEIPNFSITLMRALDGVMRFTEKDADNNSDGGSISLNELSTEGRNAYNAIREKIMNLSADLPISPMDAIRMKIEDAGYSVAEITGREMQLNRNDAGRYVVEPRKDRDKKAAMRDFNSGKLDVLMINKSGSTGISLHASSKFDDQRQRVMVFAQFQSDINDEVQMRGRIDRSGQVTRGRYEYIMSTIPAEQRIQMMFKAKLKSLDANTTSSQKSKFNEIEIVDYLNKYGDEVVWEYMKEHPELEERLGDPLEMLHDGNDDGGPRVSEKEDTSKKPGCAGKVSRYLAFLSVEEQDEIFREITEAYRVKIQLLDDAGENDLEITTMPLRADTHKKQIWHEGENPGSGNAFADNTYVEEVEVDVLKKPMKRSEIAAATRKLAGNLYAERNSVMDWEHYAYNKGEEIHQFYQTKADEAFGKMKEAGENRIAKAREKAVVAATKARGRGENNFTDAEIQSLADTVANEEREKEEQKQNKRHNEIMAVNNRIQALLNRLRAEKIYVVPQDLKGTAEMFSQTFGTFVGFKFNNGYTLGSSTAIFATLDGRRKVELALSDPAIDNIISATEIAYRYSPKDIGAISMDNWDGKVPTQSRQKRYIITGNLLQALVDTEKGDRTRGNLISFSTIDGETRQGILMGENFKPADLRSSASLSSRLNQIRDGKVVVSENGDVQIAKEVFDWRHRGQYELRVPKSKQRGGIYTMHPELLELVEDGNFTTKGNSMVAYLTDKNIAKAVDMLSRAPFNLTVLEESRLSDVSEAEDVRERSGDGSYSDADVSMENDPWSKAWGETLRSKREQRAFAKRERERMRAKAVELSERLGVDIEIIEDNSSLEGKRGRSKGWYGVKDGKISVVLGNHVSVADIEKTVLHEAVAHHGLRELLGEHFDEFLDKVYELADNSIKERIALLASRNGWNRRIATEEYLAGLAEDTDFENAKAYNGWWGKIKSLFLYMLSAFGFKHIGVELSDNELRYILWRSYKNMVEPGRFRAFEWEAEDVAMKYNLKAGEYAESSPVTEQRVAEAGELYELNDRFNNELNRQIAGDLPQGHVYDMGMPSEYLLSTGIARLPIRLSAKILNTKSNLERHAYDLETLRNLVYAIQKPWAIFSYGDRSKAQNMIIGIEDNGRQFLVGISINPTIKGRVLEINSIRNVFPKNNHEWVNWINEGKLLRVDGKKEIQDIIAKLRMNPVAFDYVDLDNAAKIVENFKNPTIREQNNNAGESVDDGVRYRMGDFTPRDRKIAADVYDKMVSSARFEFSEAMQDSMLGLKKLYEAIKGKKGFRIEEVEGYENAYIYENRMSSTNGNEQHLYFIRKMKPLLKAISDICGNSGSERRILTDYMIAKHGLERNVILAERDAREAASKGADYNDELAKCRQRDYSGLTALTGEKDLATAERVAQQMVDDYERDTDTTELWRRVKSATEATLEKMYTSGLMSEERFNQVRGMFQHYIPLRGWDETTSNEVYTYLLQDDHATGTSLTKKAGGRSSKADDPIANIAAMADSAISQGNRNIMKQRFLNFVLNNPSDLVSHNELWLEHDAVNDEWRPVFAELDAADTPADVAKKIEAFEARMKSLQAQHPDKYKRGSEAVNIPYKVVGNNLREHQVLVRRNGVTTVLTINGNPRAAQALNGLTNPDVKAGSHYDEALSVVMYVNRQLSALYTTRNPDFVVSNFMRDMLYSNCMTWIKETPSYALRYHRNFGKLNPAVMTRLLNKYENGTLNSNDYIEHAFEQFMANGGETGFTNLKDIEGHKRAIAKELRRQGNVALRSWNALGMKLDLMNRSVENCARFAAYVTSREMGRSVDRSIYDAKEISVNFNKKGSGGTMAQKNRTLLGKIGAHTSGWGRLLYVFWNAGVQGMTNYGRAAKRNPAKATAAATALFSLGWVIPLLAQAGGGDDDDKNAYYNLPSYIRRSNICFSAGDQWVTIPLPIEYRAIYGLGELAYGAISGNERYSDDELCHEVMAQFSKLLPIDMLEGGGGLSPFIPSLAKPAVEAYVMNKSWTGLPIYKDTGYNKDDPEWTKAYKNADQHLVKASRWLNEVSGGDDFKKGRIDINPAKVEYLLNGMFGGMVSFPSKVIKTVETIGGSREFEWRNIPLANRIIKSGDERTANRRLKSDYYKYKKEAMDAKRLARKYESRGQEGFMEYAEKADFLYNSPEYRRALVFTNYEPDIKTLEQSIDDAGDPNVRKMLETDLYSTMREMVNELDGIAQE